jgi:hypothetical protein
MATAGLHHFSLRISANELALVPGQQHESIFDQLFLLVASARAESRFRLTSDRLDGECRLPRNGRKERAIDR